jgi:hypothetical protein
MALREALTAHESLLRQTTSTETLVRGGALTSVANALTEHLRGQRILGYHCTREPEPGYFARRGLRATNLDEHQEEFIRTLGHHFTPSELTYMREQWLSYFDAGQKRGREGRLWACLTRKLALSRGTERFSKAYGGEAIHMPLADDSSAMKKLMKLGEPVVVEVALPGNQIRSFYEMAWCALSYHHRRINPAAHPMESEACLLGGVSAEDVLAVVPLSRFEV